MFGSTGFGTTSSTFGNGTAGFGAANSPGGGNVFGQPAQQQPGGAGFGTQQTSLLPAFGAGSGAFGAQTNTSSVFGQQPRPTTGIFGSTANAMSPFSAQTQVAGTAIPFNAITGTDTILQNRISSQVNTRHQCITCMKEYENKSLEELRMEDYQMNRKGPTNSMFGAAPQAQPSNGPFSGIGGTSAPGSSTFGQTSAFGQTTAAAGGGLFSSLNQPKPGGFFGNTATPTSTGFGGGTTLGFSFNSNPTSQPQASIFGQNHNPATPNTGLGTNSAFSFSAQPQQQQQQGLSLFGQKPLTTPASSASTFGSGFGNTATNTALNKPLFGAATGTTFGTGTSSLFSSTTQQQQQQQKPLTFTTPFGSTSSASQPTFGGTSSTSTFSFSNPVSTTNLGTAPAFGSTSSAAGTTTSFGAPHSFSYGGNTQQQQQTVTSLGSALGSGLFSGGAGNTATGGIGTGMSLFGPGGTTCTLGTGGGFGLQPQQQMQLQLQQQQQQQQIVQGAFTFATTPFKDNQLFYNLISNRKLEELTKPTNQAAQRQFREASRRGTSTSAPGPLSSSSSSNVNMSSAVKSLTFASSTRSSSISISKYQIFGGFEDKDYGMDILTPKNDVKKLILAGAVSASGSGENRSVGMVRRTFLLTGNAPITNNRASLQSPLMMNLRNGLTLNTSLSTADLSCVSPEDAIERGCGGEPNRTIEIGDSILSKDDRTAGHSSMLLNHKHNHGKSSDGDRCTNRGDINETAGFPSKKSSDVDIGNGLLLHNGKQVSSLTGGTSVCGVVCTRPSYYLKPSLDELDKMVDTNGNCIVKGLEIGRVNYGRIKYMDPVNISNINIDQIIYFRHKEVTVYPDDKNKPELGRGLNVPAEIQLDRVWPINKVTNELIRNPEEIQKLNYESKLRKACNRTGSEFVSYNHVHGIWEFKVPHFSKYGCDVEEDEEPGAGAEPPPPSQQNGLGGISQQKLQQEQASVILAGSGIPGPAGDAPMMTLGRFSMPGHYTSVIYPPSPPLPQLHDQQQLLQHWIEGNQPPQIDVELNPLTPCDSVDADVGDNLDESDLIIRRPSVRMPLQPIAHDGYRGSGSSYKSILKDCGTEKSRMLKYVMSMNEYYGDGDSSVMSILDNQPPSKKSNRQISLMLSESDFSEDDQRLAVIQEPASSADIVSTPTSYQAAANVNPSLTIIPVEPVQFSEEPIADLFSSLHPNHNTTNLKLQGSSRVCFLPNGSFVTVAQSTTLKTGEFKGQVKISQLVSYANKQEEAPASATYGAVLEKQMQDRLDRGGVLFQEHLAVTHDQIHNCSETSVKSTLESELVIWELCDILWPGEMDIEEEFLEDDGFLLEQRQRLEGWLRKHAAVLFGDEYGGSDQSVLGFLKKGLVGKGCDTAIKEGNVWLAVLLETCPHLMLNFNDEPEVLSGMSKGTTDVFALISGNMTRLSWLNADKVLGMTTHEWFQHFALFVWYHGPARTQLPISTEKAVREYEELMRDIAGDDECTLPASESSTVANLAMHILKMYSCTGYPMNVVLSPRTWSEDCLDYKLDWLLMRSLEEIGYSPGDDIYKQVCLGYTGMLEGIGKWQWCQFVMGHLPGPEVEAEDDQEAQARETLARQVFCERLLERHIGEGMCEQEAFVVRELGVSETLIYSIKSWKSILGSRRRPGEIMWYLGNMEEWQGSYALLTKYLESGQALDLIGSRLPALTRSIQKHLARLQNSKARMVGWEVHGKMLTNYLKMMYEHDDVAAMEAAVIRFTESVIKFKPVNTYQCAFLLDMALSAQKMIQLLLAEPEIIAERRARIVDNLVQFLEIVVPNEYFDGLRCFINYGLLNSTTHFRLLEQMETDDDEIED